MMSSSRITQFMTGSSSKARASALAITGTSAGESFRMSEPSIAGRSESSA